MMTTTMSVSLTVVGALLLIATAPIAEAATAPSVEPGPPPFCKVETLSKPLPASTWTCALSGIKSKFSFQDSFGAVFSSHNSSLFNNLDSSVFNTLLKSIQVNYPSHASELKDLSQAFQTVFGEYVSQEYLAGWVWFHELAHTDMSTLTMGSGCSAIITKASDGRYFHSRNMDQSPEEARRLTVRFDFYDSGELAFSAVDWYWFTTGFMTAVKPQVVTVQENWRTTTTHNLSYILDQATRGILPQVFLFRESLSSFTTTDALLATWRTTPLASPMYIVFSTNSEAGIYSRGDMVCNVTSMQPNAWYLVQTNYDPWLPDNPNDPRRTQAVTALKSYAQFGIDVVTSSPLLGYAIAMTPKVLNGGTAYTAVMTIDNQANPDQGFLLVTVHYQ